MELSGKVALITGAGVRVGRAIALELAHAGANIGVHYRTSDAPAQALADQIRLLGRRAELFQADLEVLTTCERLIEQVVTAFGRLDILVNNAAEFPKLPLEDTDAREWERTLRVNLVAPALLARAAAPYLRQNGAGRIINMADIMPERPPRGYAAYCTSKAGVIGLTRALAIELAPEVTVNAIAPGIAEFPESYDQSTRERLVAKVPLQRAGSPEEVAALARYLVEHGDYITGQIIPIDGGRSIRP